MTRRAGVAVDAREVVSLSRAECMALLAAHDFGRVVVATASAGTPLIRPVNYRFDAAKQSIVFLTLEGSKLHSLAHSAGACFEIDGRDPGRPSGWSVIVVGPVEEVTHPSEVARLSHLGVPTWLDGTPQHWIRIRARTVSGRRLVPVVEAMG